MGVGRRTFDFGFLGAWVGGWLGVVGYGEH